MNNKNPASGGTTNQHQESAAFSKDFENIILPPQKYRILVVDDTSDILALLKLYLEQEGYIVKTVESGKEALKVLDEFLPDVLCIDFVMPEMNGQELARLIRNRKDMLYIPIVMLTAVGGVDSIRFDSLKSGVDAFLTKPVKREELKITIRTMLRMKAAQDNMMAALDRIAQVQDELLRYERQRGQFEAMHTTIDTFNFELVAPLHTAQTALTKLEELFAKIEADNIDKTQIVSEGKSETENVRSALNQAEESLKILSETSKNITDKFMKQH